MKMAIFKKGGEPGDVAVNPGQVTHVREGSGAFTDIYFGRHRVAVVATFAQVIAGLGAAKGIGTEGQEPARQ